MAFRAAWPGSGRRKGFAAGDQGLRSGTNEGQATQPGHAHPFAPVPPSGFQRLRASRGTPLSPTGRIPSLDWLIERRTPGPAG